MIFWLKTKYKKILKWLIIGLSFLYLILEAVCYFFNELYDQKKLRFFMLTMLIFIYFMMDSDFHSNIYLTFPRRVVRYIFVFELLYFINRYFEKLSSKWMTVFSLSFLTIDIIRVLSFEYLKSVYYKTMLNSYNIKLMKFHRVCKYLRNNLNKSEIVIDNDGMINSLVNCDGKYLKDSNILFKIFCEGKRYIPTEGYEEVNQDVTLNVEDYASSDFFQNYESVLTENFSDSRVNSDFENTLHVNEPEEETLEPAEVTNLPIDNENQNLQIDFINLQPEILSAYPDEDTEINTRDADSSDLRHRQNSRQYITQNTLRMLFNEEISSAIFDLFSSFIKKNINSRIFKENHIQVMKEINFLKNSFKDCKRLFDILNFILIILEVNFIGFFTIKTMGVDFGLMSIFYSMFMFTFLPSIKQVIESFFYILVNHPFDCGDRIFINGENLMVKKIKLFNTVFEKWNGELVIINNQTLSKTPITNIHRSGSQKLVIPIVINKKDIQKIKLVEKDILKYIDKKKRFKSVIFSIVGISECTHIKYEIIITQNSNFQNGFFMWRAHTTFMKELKRKLIQHKIKFYPINQTIQQS